jgi:DNA-binding transcriptional LysR family regulator
VAGRSLDIDQIAAIRAFVRIVETGSFTQAARTLAMPKATITKHIQLLEAHLRAKLLSRTTRRMAVTVDGAAYYERAVRLLAELDELDSTVTASPPCPTSRPATPTSNWNSACPTAARTSLPKTSTACCAAATSSTNR